MWTKVYTSVCHKCYRACGMRPGEWLKSLSKKTEQIGRLSKYIHWFKNHLVSSNHISSKHCTRQNSSACKITMLGCWGHNDWDKTGNEGNVAFVSHHKFVLIYIMKTAHLLKMIFNEEEQRTKL